MKSKSYLVMRFSSSLSALTGKSWRGRFEPLLPMGQAVGGKV